MAKQVDDPAKASRSEMNMTPMIDVTFQLIIVFLCSMKFRTLDQKIEAFLPKDVGLSQAPAVAEVETKISVKLRRTKGGDSTQVYLLDARLGTTASPGVWEKLAAELRGFKAKDEKIKAEIDAESEVLHGEVVRALDSFMAAGLTNIVFRGTALNKTGKFEKQPGPRK
jgi:biopolymer transport protein ExbD